MRLRTVIIFGIGYLWGSRAGRDRYEYLSEATRSVAESARDVVTSPAVTRYVDVALGAVGVPRSDVAERVPVGRDEEPGEGEEDAHEDYEDEDYEDEELEDEEEEEGATAGRRAARG